MTTAVYAQFSVKAEEDILSLLTQGLFIAKIVGTMKTKEDEKMLKDRSYSYYLAAMKIIGDFPELHMKLVNHEKLKEFRRYKRYWGF